MVKFSVPTMSCLEPRWLRLAVITLATATAFTWAAGAFQSARAGHSIVGGDCWQVGTPLMCRTNWQGANTPLYLRVDDQISPAAAPWMQTAIDNGLQFGILQMAPK